MVIYHIKYVSIMYIILLTDISYITRSVKFQFRNVYYKWSIIIILLRIYMLILNI